MNVEQVESELNEEQTTEVLRRRREYAIHQDGFDRVDKKSLDRMFNRIRKKVADRLLNPHCQRKICR